MFHLFSKVYLVSDKLININYDRVVISEEHGHSMYEALYKVSSGELIDYASSIDDILLKYEFDDFIQMLKNRIQETDKKILIYVDDVNFSKFLAIWFKSIFINISVEEAWTIVSSHVNKEKFLKNSRSSDTSTEEDIFSSVTKEKFLIDFGNANSFDLTEISKFLSLDLLLVNYLSTRTYKEELKTSCKTLLTRSLVEIAIEIKYSFVKNFNKSNYPALSKDFDFFTNSSIYTIPSLGRVSSHSNNVNFQTATEEDISKFKRISSQLLLEWEQMQSQSSIFNLISFVDVIRKDIISDEDLENIINFEKTSLGTIRMFSSADEEKMNIYFLDFVLNSNPENLSGYALK